MAHLASWRPKTDLKVKKGIFGDHLVVKGLNELNCSCLPSIINILLTERSRSLWDLVRLYMCVCAHCVRSVLTTLVKILPYRPPARLIRAKYRMYESQMSPNRPKKIMIMMKNHDVSTTPRSFSSASKNRESFSAYKIVRLDFASKENFKRYSPRAYLVKFSL